MFLQSWLNLIIIFQSGFLPQNSGKDQKKGFRRILVLSQSGISDFLMPNGYYLPKNQGSQTYFVPFRVRPEEAPPPLSPEIDAYAPTQRVLGGKPFDAHCSGGLCADGILIFKWCGKDRFSFTGLPIWCDISLHQALIHRKDQGNFNQQANIQN